MNHSAQAHCALDDCPDAVISLDAQDRVVRWNAAAAALLGVQPDEALGRELGDVVRLTARGTTDRFPERQWACARGGAGVAVEVTGWTSTDHGVESRHLCLRDATARLEMEGEQERVEVTLRRQARSDALTGLANRYEFEERLAAALQHEADGAGQVALVVVDLDGFKPINDSFGHAVGDEVLAALGQRLAAAVRREDTVARFGGDEFVVLSTLQAGTNPATMIARLRRALADPVTTSAGQLTVGSSLGVAVSDSDIGMQDLLRRADKAMYRVKLARTSS